MHTKAKKKSIVVSVKVQGDSPHLVEKGLLIFGIFAYVVYFFWQQDNSGIVRANHLISTMFIDELVKRTAGDGTRLQFGLLDRSLPLGLGLGWMLVSYGIGRSLLFRLRPMLCRLEFMTLAGLAGLGLLSTLTLWMGLFGWLNRNSLLITVGLLTASALWRVQHIKKTTAGGSFVSIAPANYESQLAVWLWRLVAPISIIVVLMYVGSALVPPFEFDVVEYHLQGPKEFYQGGRISFIDHNVYLNMPLGCEMHALAMMKLIGGNDGWWLGAIAGKLIMASFSVMTAVLAGAWLARKFGRSSGWASAALILASPLNIHVSGCGLNDMSLGAYALAVAILLQELWSARSSSKNVERASTTADLSIDHTVSPNQAGHDFDIVKSQFRTLVTSILFFSFLTATCKYTGLIFVTLPAMALLCFGVWRRHSSGELMRMPTIAALMLIALLGPWLGKNWKATGNPVYPLASNLFGSGNLSDSQMARWNKAHQVPRSEQDSAYGWRACALTAMQLFVGSQNLPVGLVPLLIVGVWGGRFLPARSQKKSIGSALDTASCRAVWVPICLTVWIVASWWLMTHRIERFWLPSVALMATLAGIGVHRLVAIKLEVIPAALVLISLWYAVLLCLTGNETDNRWFCSYESLRKDVGTDEYPGRLPAAIGWINTKLPQNAKLAVIGDARAFHYERPILYATCFNTPPGESELNSQDDQVRKGWLSSHQISHILVHWDEIARYRQTGNYGFADWPTREQIDQLIANGIVRRVSTWPFEPTEVELLEVISNN